MSGTPYRVGRPARTSRAPYRVGKPALAVGLPCRYGRPARTAEPPRPDEKTGPRTMCARPRLRAICPDAALRRTTGYSRATTASPMAAVPSTCSAGVDPSAMSRVRKPASSTAVTAARTSSAASPMSRL